MKPRRKLGPATRRSPKVSDWWRVIGNPGGDVRRLDELVRERLDELAVRGAEPLMDACRDLRNIVWGLEVDTRFGTTVASFMGFGFADFWCPAIGAVAWGREEFESMLERPIRWWEIVFSSGVTPEAIAAFRSDMVVASELFDWVTEGAVFEHTGIDGFDLQVDYSVLCNTRLTPGEEDRLRSYQAQLTAAWTRLRHGGE